VKDYWLAKLISSVDAVDSRKRLQKAVYLLQQAGCPFACDYLLHYYGPYSFELAGLIDQLSSAGIIEETTEPFGAGAVRYRYAVTERGNKALGEFERTSKGRQLATGIAPFVDPFKKLSVVDPWVLELAATVAFYHKDNWAEAQRQTSLFKKVSQGDSHLKQAIKLARRFKQPA